MKVTLDEFREENGFQEEEAFQEYLENAVFDGVCFALCDEGCEVEPDGVCPHGCPSVLLALGVI